MAKIYVSLFFLTLVAAFNLSAQITHEHTYSGTAETANVETFGYKYYVTDYLNNSIDIYNEDHTAWKSISLPVPASQYLYDVAYVSSKVFNTDDNVEFMMVYYGYVSLTDTTGYYTYSTEVVSENGQVLLSVPGGAYSFTYTDAANKNKLVVYVYDYSVSSYITATEIYSLPDKASALKENQSSVLNPFPDPTFGLINLPLSNLGNYSSEMVITDITGKEYSRIPVSNNATTLQYQASVLPAGNYLYSVHTNGKVLPAGRFIKK
jgi:hypothetical protein